MSHHDFLSRWQTSGGAEHANYGLFLQDLCDLLGVPRPDPTTDDPAQDAYVLERGVTFDDGAGKRTTGRIDLYKRGCFVLETKQGVTRSAEVAGDIKNARTHGRTDARTHGRTDARTELGLPAKVLRQGHAVRETARWGQMLEAAREQALRYVRALPASEPRPPFVVVVDVGYSLDLYSNFAGVGDSYVPFPDPQHFRLRLTDLAAEPVRERLRLLFADPQQLDPARHAARVTRRLAGYLAGLSSQLEADGHAPVIVAQFLMRCLFTMFAEDVGLLPAKCFTGLLADFAATPERRADLSAALGDLWQSMDQGGYSPTLRVRVRQFNGKLFHGATALPLTADQLELLQLAAAADWREVEPAIFGTLLERALDPRERHRLGAHYTPRRYVERLVLPTVLEPLRREWAAAQAASAQRLAAGGKKAVAEARAELLTFLRRLTSVRVLDPACGSGNFLYVTLEHLKRLEGEVLAALGQLGQSGRLELGDRSSVGPRQLLGLELNPRAATIADVVLRIGYLQWHLRTHGLTELREPLLDDYHNIRQQDAVLATNGPDLANPRPAEWPAADFIVGNPPFLGDKAMRRALGDTYVRALRQAYAGRVPESADFVLYWWQQAAEAVAAGRAERFGFITTNSITQTFNRRLVQEFLRDEARPLSLTYAIADHPWVDAADGAAVRVAFTLAERGHRPGTVLRVARETAGEDDATDVVLTQVTGLLNADLTVGADVTGAAALQANAGLCFQGIKLVGAGFVLTATEAADVAEADRAVVRPYLTGKDLSARPRHAHVIDLFGLSEAEAVTHHPALYQRLLMLVKPERDRVARAAHRDRWWQFGEPRSGFRQAVAGLRRYLATSEVAKHRVFTFVDAAVLPDGSLMALTLDDAYWLGVLSSRPHQVWTLAAGGLMGVGATPRYTSSRCFLPFPFPTATAAQQARIRALAEALDAHRRRQQAKHPALTLTDLYNVVEQLRAGQPLTPKEQILNEQGLAAVVLRLHQQLDAAVAEAYGWPADLPEAELLTRLVQLNQQRQAEEAAGHVRYLRPAYQAPQPVPGSLPLSPVSAPSVAAAGPQPWPTTLAQQLLAVRAAVQQAGTPQSAAQVGARFRGVSAKKVQPLLDTLAQLALVRFLTEENEYAA